MTTTKTTEWFVAERVRALSMVYLTRRDDLFISETKEDYGFDFSVDIIKDEARTTRRFGIVLRGTKSPVSDATANQQLKPSMAKLVGIEEFPFPVCIFYFTMDDSKGRYTWVAEPIVDEDGHPRLELHRVADCKPLDSAAVDTIVRTVDQWYDSLFEMLK